MDKQKLFAIGFIIYNSNYTLLARLKLVLDMGFSVYIFDNSPEQETVRMFCKENQNTHYSTCGKNVGLGISLSAICAQAYYDDFSALLFFDQDTCFDANTLNYIKTFYLNRSLIETNYTAVVFNNRDIKRNNFLGQTIIRQDLVENSDPYDLKDVKLIINSGSLFFLENVKKIGWHNTNYFVDAVDYEFCLRTINRNLKLGMCSKTPGYDHDIEQGNTVYRIFNKKIIIKKYPNKRILDSTVANIKLLFSSLASKKISFSILIMKLFVVGTIFQGVARIFSALKLQERPQS